MKKWSTSWVPSNILSQDNHQNLSEQITAISLDPVDGADREPMPDLPNFSSFIRPPEKKEVIIEGHTDEALEKAKKQAYQEGLQKGTAEGTEKGKGERLVVEKQLEQVVNKLATQIQNQTQVYEKEREQERLDVVTLALQIARKVAHEALNEQPETAIESLVNQCIEFALHEPSFVIQLHPEMAPVMTEYLTKQPGMAERMGKQVIIEPKEELALTDCTMQWQNGGANLSINERWQQIERVLEHYRKEPVVTAEPAIAEPSDEPAETENQTPEDNGDPTP